MKPCCQDMNNRGSINLMGKGLTYTQCQVCNRKHYEVTLDPYHFKTVGAPLGR
jgi:hypothetical protein